MSAQAEREWVYSVSYHEQGDTTSAGGMPALEGT
jgi:hypothetical protein